MVSSSQKVKEETAKLLPGYTESMDVISVAKWGMKEHVQAIQNSEIRNSRYDDALKEVDKNPYTEVAGVVTELIRHKKGD